MQGIKEQQQFFMRWAIRLGEKGRITAPPNPWVGCVLTKNGEMLAEGYHEAVGKKHAEVVALEKAGALARGATAYVSLEPCSHQGRTPPCANQLIKAGIKKVVIPFLDPDPLVAGKGVEILQNAGVEVIIGVCEEEAKLSLKPYLHQRLTKRSFCVLKSAMSLDGHTAAADGSSQWITGEEARKDAHQLRAESQAILIGSQTALLDRPQLTVRHLKVEHQPLRVLLDLQGKVPVQGPLADSHLAPTLVFTASIEHQKAWEKCATEVILMKKFDLAAVLEELGSRKIIQVLVEGGSRLHAAFLKEQLANHFTLYVGSCLLGASGQAFIPDLVVPNMNQAPRWTLLDVRRLGNDVRLDFQQLVI